MVGFLMLSMLILGAVRHGAAGVPAPDGSNASMICSVGPESKVQTSGVRHPDGSVFALAITSDDDHIKSSHQCESAYSLLVTRSGEPARSVNLGFGTIDQYGRRLEIRAEGFSPDSKRFFGLACESGVAIKGESGKRPHRKDGVNATLIEYQIVSGHASTIDLSRLIPYAPGCGAEAIRVIGVTPGGEAVLALNDRGLTRKWAIQSESKSIRPLSNKMSFSPLYRP